MRCLSLKAARVSFWSRCGCMHTFAAVEAARPEVEHHVIRDLVPDGTNHACIFSRSGGGGGGGS
jgi:hypothetical protein